MAWHTIQATDDLLIELHLAGEALGPGPKDRADNQPLLKIRSKATEGEMVSTWTRCATWLTL